MNDSTNNIFDQITEFPESEAKRRYNRLVGLDEIKQRLLKEARIILNPSLVEAWSQKTHKKVIKLTGAFKERSPLFLFGGDVGVGKTELAETFGDKIAREEDIQVTLYSLSLNSRGGGTVGEMTKLITSAFNEVTEAARKVVSSNGKARAAVILLIDEADSIAQSREFSQMHHEDRAGVNALIRGVSNFTTDNLPAIAVMCTNRLDSIDPAVRRRAADTFIFARPNNEQREAIFRSALSDVNFSNEQILMLTKATGPSNESPGYTYSDLTQRFLPDILLDAFPDNPVKFERAYDIAKKLQPTPAFKDSSSSK